MKKVLLVVVLTMAMLVGLIGCGSNSSSNNTTEPTSAGTSSNGESGSTSTDNGSTSGTDSSAIDTSEHVVITYMTTGDAPTNGATEEVIAELNKILTEKVNAELQIYYISWTDWLSNYNLTLAQMDGSVDLVGTATDWLDAWPNTQKGAFLALSEDMLQTYAPQTWASVSQDHWNMCKYDGEIYLMPEDNYAQWINHGYMYRGDWAAEAGLTNGVHSWEDLTTYYEYVKGAYPDVIPWDSDGSAYNALGYITSKSDYVAIDGLSVAIFGSRQSDLYTVYSPFYEGDELVNYAKLMKQWDELGVWKTDVLNNSADNREEFYLGETASDQHHTETWYGTVKPKMDEQQPGSDVGFFYFGEESQNLVKLSITHGAMAISAASKNPERALMVYDLLRNDPECYNLLNIGIEGVQYEVVDGGYYQRPASYTDEANGITTNYWWGRNDSIALKYAGRAWSDYEDLTAIYKTFAIDYPYGQVVWSQDNFSSQISNISDIYNEYMPKICFGKFDDAESIVAEFRSKLQAAGIEDVIADLQSQMDTFKASQQ